MSDEPPETPTKAARVLIGWFAGGLAFKSVDTFNPDTMFAIAPIGYGLGAIAVAIVDYKLKTILAHSPKLVASLNQAAADARLWIAVAMLSLLIIAISPYVERQRWPFADWFETKRVTGIDHDRPTEDEINKAAEAKNEAYRKSTDAKILDLEHQLTTQKTDFDTLSATVHSPLKSDAEKRASSTAQSLLPQSFTDQSVADLERIKARLSELYDLINTYGSALTGADPEIDFNYADPHLIPRSGGFAKARARALAAKAKLTEFGQAIDRLLATYSHDSDVLKAAATSYQSSIYDLRNAMEDYAGNIPTDEITPDQFLKKDGIWGSHADLMVKFDVFRKWLADVTGTSGRIKRIESELNQRLQNAH
jgi:hypothetical protein